MEALLLWYIITVANGASDVLTESPRVGTQGLIFVIDSNDRARIDEAQQELHRIILDREMKEALLLVFANKQDIAGGACISTVSSRAFDY